MAYKTYITGALVCGVKPSNTSDQLFLLFTREAGMLFAHARSVREEKSKHRYSIQPFSYVRVTLVRGKGGWKITGTEPIQNFFSETTTREVRTLVRNVTLLLRRVMQGETVYPEIFDDVIGVYKSAKTYDTKSLELILSLRILNTLGYVAPLPSYQGLLSGEISIELIKELSPEIEIKCKELIEYALAQSQL